MNYDIINIGDFMNEVNDKDVVDFFTEEMTKKQKKEQKKLNKNKKKQAKKEKQLEKLEDIEFAKKLEEKDNEDIISNVVTREEIHIEKNNKKHPFLNFLLGMFIIILFLTSCDYLIFNVLKQNDIKLIITSSLLCVLAITYILSILIKKEGIKKFFQILATISIAAYMLYQLYII